MAIKINKLIIFRTNVCLSILSSFRIQFLKFFFKFKLIILFKFPKRNYFYLKEEVFFSLSTVNVSVRTVGDISLILDTLANKISLDLKLSIVCSICIFLFIFPTLECSCRTGGKPAISLEQNPRNCIFLSIFLLFTLSHISLKKLNSGVEYC